MNSSARIVFDENLKTFSLYPGASLYSFCISPELSLEHLYWGKRLHSGFDLRYLSQSSRQPHFNTAEVYESKPSFSNLDELQELWKKDKIKLLDETDAARLENIMKRVEAMKNLKPLPDEVTYNSPSDGDKGDDACVSVPTSPTFKIESNSRRRSATVPSQSFDHSIALSTNFADNDNSSKSSSFASSPGISINSPRFRPSHQRAFDRGGGIIGKGALCVEYSDYGTGDFRSPSFVVLDNFDGSSISPLRYRHHKIVKGKPPMPDNMPGIRCHDVNEATTLIVTMADVGSGLEVDLIYGKFPNRFCCHHNRTIEQSNR